MYFFKLSATGEFMDIGNGLDQIAEEHGIIIWDNGTLLIPRAERRHEGRYLCEANNGVGAGLSEAVNLQVHGKI